MASILTERGEPDLFRMNNLQITLTHDQEVFTTLVEVLMLLGWHIVGTLGTVTQTLPIREGKGERKLARSM